MNFQELRDASKPWAEHNFPNATPIEPALGMIEEVGELAHAYLKRKQGIRGTTEEHDAAMKDAVADIAIYLANYVDMTTPDVSLRTVCGGDSGTSEKCLTRLATWVSLLADDYALVQETTVDQVDYILQLLQGFCHTQGWDLWQIVEDVWAEVSKRDWIAFPKDGLTE